MNKSEEYQQKKQKLVDQAQQTEASLGLQKNTSNLFRQTKEETSQKLDVRSFNNVLEINTQEGWADIEGMTTYEDLIDATLEHNHTPCVAPELKSITLGGAISGVGVESSSFKYGFVHETVLEMDILTGNGEVITASPTQNQDLFYAIPNSYGTLGYVLRAKIKIIPVKPFVKIEREKYTDYDQYVDDIVKYSTKARQDNTYDYIEGLIISKNEMYLSLCSFTDNPPFVSDYTYLNIFYKSADKKEDYLKTKDYIFRYDTDWFWTTKSMGLENPILRRLFGRKRLRSDVYHKLFKWESKYKILTTIRNFLGKKSETFIQDAEVKAEDAASFLRWFHQNISDEKPLTIGAVIPYSKTATFTLFPMDPDQVYMNIGYYAGIQSDKEEGYYNRLFEKKLMQLGAKKMMYSDSYYTKEEFWSIFNKQAYEQLKQKYDPNNRFKDLYQKTVSKKR